MDRKYQHGENGSIDEWSPAGKVEIWSHERWGYRWRHPRTARMSGYIDHTGWSITKSTN